VNLDIYSGKVSGICSVWEVATVHEGACLAVLAEEWRGKTGRYLSW